MKVACFILALAVVIGIKEPLPINPEEEGDEVAFAQKRAVWIACLSLTQTIVESKMGLISNKAKAGSVPTEKIIRKFSAESLENCEKSTTYALAERYLSGENSEEVQKFSNSVFSILLDQETANFELTESQNALIGKIKSQAEFSDEGFNQVPPVVPEVYSIQDNKTLYLIAGASCLLILIVVWKLTGDEPTKESESPKRSGKKKRD